jgi:predicted ribosomally synthesized peptide with nif11-like leader
MNLDFIYPKRQDFMTKKDAKRFIERIETEPNFRARFKNAKSPEAKKAVLKRARLCFTKQEFNAVWKELKKKRPSSSELRQLAAAGKKGKASAAKQLKMDSLFTEMARPAFMPVTLIPE